MKHRNDWAIRFMTRVMRHVVEGQPVTLSACTRADDMAMDIVSICAQMLHAERDMDRLLNRESESVVFYDPEEIEMLYRELTGEK